MNVIPQYKVIGPYNYDRIKYKYFFKIYNVNAQQPNFQELLCIIIVISQKFHLK